MTTIYSSWLQGYTNAPDQVKTCLDRWYKLNPSYVFKLLEWSEVENLLSDFPHDIRSMTHQSLSDIVRIALLKKTGGIWVDATVFPTKPLSEWVVETIGDAEFFSYRRDGDQVEPKDRPISAWFLYATKDSVIIEKLWREILQYWSVDHYPILDSDKKKYYEDPIAFMGLSESKPSLRYPYHWFQHIFAYLIKNDPVFAKAWDACPYKSMSQPHLLQYWAREELIDKNAQKYLTEEKIKEIVEDSEMQKLNWRMEFPIAIMEKYSAPYPQG